MSSETSRRPYRLKERAAGQERTRRRIAEAAMELHGSVGPARTSVSAVAARAGVQRATVYRHFPDEAALFAACSAHWASLHPAPDPDRWARIADPDERLATALGELYGWFRDGEEMLSNVIRDEPNVPALREHVGELRGYFSAVGEVLLAGRPAGGAGRRRLAAALGHASDFEVWRSLARRELTDAEIIALMTALVAASIAA